MPVERELMRGAGPAAVLHLLHSREMYGYELAQALDRSTAGVLGMGQSTLYPLLYNLESKGLIRGTWKSAPNGRRRKYYALTEDGERRLAAQRREWSELVGAMQDLGLVERGQTS